MYCLVPLRIVLTCTNTYLESNKLPHTSNSSVFLRIPSKLHKPTPTVYSYYVHPYVISTEPEIHTATGRIFRGNLAVLCLPVVTTDSLAVSSCMWIYGPLSKNKPDLPLVYNLWGPT